jgi:3-deoxy-D-manno-octulosonate 8-phosphate phosphatase (KDO 8-P phosphatase)
MSMTVKQRAKKIRMLILDIDGVMTDGRIIYDSRGNELKCFNVLDGMGLALLNQTGIKVALISAKGSPAVKRRAREIGAVEVKENSIDKLTAFRQILKRHDLSARDICFIGDDLLDLPLMKRAGLSVAVPGACPEVKRAARYLTKKEGGKGAVREVIEIILRAQNKWRKLVGKYDR